MIYKKRYIEGTGGKDDTKGDSLCAALYAHYRLIELGVLPKLLLYTYAQLQIQQQPEQREMNLSKLPYNCM